MLPPAGWQDGERAADCTVRRIGREQARHREIPIRMMAGNDRYACNTGLQDPVLPAIGEHRSDVRAIPTKSLFIVDGGIQTSSTVRQPGALLRHVASAFRRGAGRTVAAMRNNPLVVNACQLCWPRSAAARMRWYPEVRAAGWLAREIILCPP